MDCTMDTKEYKNYSDLSYEYNVAALLLWNSIAESPYLFNPFMFLSRHTIELLLKGLIKKNCPEENQQRIDHNGKNIAMSNTHVLSALWKHYLQYRQNIQMSLSSASDEEKITRILSKIETADLNSTNYRYPYHKDGSKLTLNPIKVSKKINTLPSIGKTPPLIVESNDGVHAVKSGKYDLLLGEQTILVIEMLFDMIEK